jgi:hypothetical protein
MQSPGFHPFKYGEYGEYGGGGMIKKRYKLIQCLNAFKYP